MHINFKTLRYCNFLSTGNQFTEIKLDKSQSTLITGKNGSGKSSILDALMYGLYGKAYRNINNPQLINSMTKKGLLVEVEFDVGKKKYLVRRGLAPTIFEIYQNGKLLKQDAANRDYQKNFVKNILRLSDRSFKQIVVLGAANYQPFMQLSAGARRGVTEDILDINIFSTMNMLHSRNVSDNKLAIKDNETQLTILTNKLELTKKHIASLRSNNDDLIEQKKTKIENLLVQKEVLDADVQKINEEIEQLNPSVSEKDKLEKKYRKLEEYEKDYKIKLAKINKDIKFFHDYDNCPTCKQQIDEAFKSEAVEKRERKSKELSDALSKMNAIYKDLDAKISEVAAINDKISDLNRKIFQDNQTISFILKEMADLKDEIERLKVKTDTMIAEGTSIQDIQSEIKKTNSAKERLVKEKAMLDVSGALLKDSGIKTRIIKQYIPIINKLVNKYLASMDFFCDFRLDENFKETIRSRGRDDFSYESFSEGEKARINLSVLFAWRAIAKLRNSASTNLLVLDEVFDSSADAMGVDAIIHILMEELANNNVFVISHNEKMTDKFRSSIEFEKVKGFSAIKRN